MKMLYAEFECSYPYRLKMKGRTWADPSSTFVAIHDMMEHGPHGSRWPRG